MDGFEAGTEYIFFSACTKADVEYGTVSLQGVVKLTKLSNTTFSINPTPPDMIVPENIKFCRGAALVVADINASRVRVTLDGQFDPGFTRYGNIMVDCNKCYYQMAVGYVQSRCAYQAYKQLEVEIKSPFRTTGTVLCGWNGPSATSAYHFRHNSFFSPLIATDSSPVRHSLTADGKKFKHLFFVSTPWFYGGAVRTGPEYGQGTVNNDYLRLISGTRVTVERWVET